MIWESDDDLGYFFGDPIPEFYPGGALAECNRILPEADQWAITQAAGLAHQGLHIPAEHCRAMARYDRLGGA